MVRLKNRYIVIEINKSNGKDTDSLKIQSQSLETALLYEIQRMHGDFGSGAVMSGFSAKYCNEKTRIAIIKCRHGPHRLVTSTLPFIKLIDNNHIYTRILYISATIRKAFYFLKNYQQMKVDEFCANLKTDSERNVMKQAILDLISAQQFKIH